MAKTHNRITFYLTDAETTKFREIARQEFGDFTADNISVSSQARFAIRQWILEHGDEDPSTLIQSFVDRK